MYSFVCTFDSVNSVNSHRSSYLSMEQYEKGKELGRGTFGAVYAARRKKDGLEVAIKRVHAGLGSDGVDFTALREITAMSRCDSEHVVRLVDVFAGKDKIFVVMELLATDLHRVITNKAFPLTQGHAKGFAAQLLAGLEHLHGRWVAHRDLKVPAFPVVLLVAHSAIGATFLQFAPTFLPDALPVHSPPTCCWRPTGR